MYCVALIHYILVFHWVLVDNHRSNVLKDAAISCYQTLDTSTFQGSLCLQGIDEITGSIAAESDAALAALLLINVGLILSRARSPLTRAPPDRSQRCHPPVADLHPVAAQPNPEDHLRLSRLDSR